MSARPALCGGYHVSGIPTAILEPFGYELNGDFTTTKADGRFQRLECVLHCCTFERGGLNEGLCHHDWDSFALVVVAHADCPVWDRWGPSGSSNHLTKGT